jgi:hypothetical protein
MKSLLAIVFLVLSSQAFSQVKCNELSGDSVVLCKQNKRILKRLRNLGGFGGAPVRVVFYDENDCTDEWASITLRGAPEQAQCESLARRLGNLSDSHVQIESVSIDGQCQKADIDRNSFQQIVDYCLNL